MLIIEDEPVLRDVYARILKVEGYKIELAENGKVGMAKLKSFKPDLILLDMLMPVMSGEKFLQLAEIPVHYPTVKVIVISNLSFPITAKQAKKYGTIESLVKSDLAPLDLVQAVQKHCPLK